jgi:hypothetical protein
MDQPETTPQDHARPWLGEGNEPQGMNGTVLGGKGAFALFVSDVPWWLVFHHQPQGVVVVAGDLIHFPLVWEQLRTASLSTLGPGRIPMAQTLFGASRTVPSPVLVEILMAGHHD